MLVAAAVFAWRAYSAYDTVTSAAENISTLADADASMLDKTMAGLELAASVLGGKAGRESVGVAAKASDHADPSTLLPRQGRSEMSGSQVRRLRSDMHQNGFDPEQPIDVANVDGRRIILDGHHRAEAARQAGLGEVPIRTHSVSNEQADQLMREAAQAAAEKNR